MHKTILAGIIWAFPRARGEDEHRAPEHSDTDGKAVVARMKAMETDDPLFGKGTIRADGRKMHDTFLYEVKKPEESKAAWDYYKLRATIPAAEGFRPLNEGGCPLVSG